jgi:hypothetical protein
MHDLRNARRRKHSHQWGEIGKRQRINACSVALRRQLQQTQFGAVRTLPQKLSIHAYVLARFEIRGELSEGGRCRDYVFQRLRR